MDNELKENSKRKFTTFDTNNQENVKLGAILRIADATEKMASNYTRMENGLKWYKEKYQEKMARIQKLERSNASLRGHLKKTKDELKSLKFLM